MSSTSLRTGVDLKRPQTEHHCLSQCPCCVLLYFVLIFPQVLSSDVVFSDAAGAPHPGTAPQEGQAWPNRQSSSGRPGSSRTPPHTAAWGSLCPTPAVCCTEGKKRGAGGRLMKRELMPRNSWVVGHTLITWRGSEVDEQATGEQSGYLLLPFPDPPKPPAAVPSSWHRTRLSIVVLCRTEIFTHKYC